MLKKLLFSITLCLIALSGFAQNVNIPDANFKAYLLGNTSINTNSDTEIQVSEASAFAGTINVDNSNIFDLTGIEAFTEIIGLRCSNNELTVLDISANTELRLLYCFDNAITSINTASNIELTNFSCQRNQISNLDLSTNTLLSVLFCSSNLLESLDVTSNTLLTKLSCNGNELESLDITNNSAIIELICDSNPTLTSLNIANGNNTNMIEVDATNNPILSCIQVDASTDLNNPPMGWIKDVTASYSYDCGNLSIPESKLSNINIYPNPFNSELFIEGLDQPSAIKIYNILGKLVLKTLATSIDTRDLNSGLYILKIEAAQGSVSKKLIKQ